MSKGRFGIHGGQYIPETLMNAVIELEEAYHHYKDDPEFNRELTELFNEYAGRPVPAVLCCTYDGGSWRREGLPEARGSEPYRCAQDQQRARSGTAGEENGKDPCHRGDRSRSARSGDSDSGGTDGHGM